jgi:hypothetical protein
MNHEIKAQHLKRVERHVREGRGHVARQQALVAELHRRGLDADLARALLVKFEQLQALHVADRDRLRAELGL